MFVCFAATGSGRCRRRRRRCRRRDRSKSEQTPKGFVYRLRGLPLLRLLVFGGSVSVGLFVGATDFIAAAVAAFTASRFRLVLVSSITKVSLGFVLVAFGGKVLLLSRRRRQVSLLRNGRERVGGMVRLARGVDLGISGTIVEVIIRIA